MTESFFLSQIDRLKRRFGVKQFDDEFIKLASFDVSQMSDEGFRRAIDVWIGSRPITKPPLIVDFKEAKLKEERLRFESTIRGASETLNTEAQYHGLRAFLAKEYPGCKTVMEAIEVQILRNQINEANAKEEDETKNNRENDREPDTGMAQDAWDFGF